MRTLDEVGAAIEQQLDGLELQLGRSRIGPILLGAALALGTVLGGLIAFIAVLVVLVGVFH